MPTHMKMLLTRIVDDCKVVVNGDVNQKEIHEPNGLADAVERVSFILAVGHVRFTKADVVRSDLCQEIVGAYEGEAAQCGAPLLE